MASVQLAAGCVVELASPDWQPPEDVQSFLLLHLRLLQLVLFQQSCHSVANQWQPGGDEGGQQKTACLINDMLHANL